MTRTLRRRKNDQRAVRGDVCSLYPPQAALANGCALGIGSYMTPPKAVCGGVGAPRPTGRWSGCKKRDVEGDVPFL